MGKCRRWESNWRERYVFFWTLFKFTVQVDHYINSLLDKKHEILVGIDLINSTVDYSLNGRLPGITYPTEKPENHRLKSDFSGKGYVIVPIEMLVLVSGYVQNVPCERHLAPA